MIDLTYMASLMEDEDFDRGGVKFLLIALAYLAARNGQSRVETTLGELASITRLPLSGVEVYLATLDLNQRIKVDIEEAEGEGKPAARVSATLVGNDTLLVKGNLGNLDSQEYYVSTEDEEEYTRIKGNRLPTNEPLINVPLHVKESSNNRGGVGETEDDDIRAMLQAIMEQVGTIADRVDNLELLRTARPPRGERPERQQREPRRPCSTPDCTAMATDIPERDGDPTPDKCAYCIVREAYGEILEGKKNMPKLLPPTSKTHQDVKAAWKKQYFRENFRAALHNVRKSEFHMTKPFFTLKWFVGPNNFDKVLEADYGDGAGVEYARVSRSDEGGIRL